MDEQIEQQDYSKVPKQLLPHVFKKGQSGNPLGRPPGRSLKDRAKAYLAGLTDEEAVEFFEGIDKIKVWEMAEGKPSAEITGKDGEAIKIEAQIIGMKIISDGTGVQDKES